MDILVLVLILVSLVLGILIGSLISNLKRSSPGKKSPPSPAPKRAAARRVDQSPATPHPRPRPQSPTESPPVQESPSPAAEDETQPSSPPPNEDKSTDSRSIVEQVDDILQEKLASSPLTEKGIFLQEDPKKGMVIWVGLNSYEGIDDLPDPAIRDIIRSAVREWEAKTSVE